MSANMENLEKLQKELEYWKEQCDDAEKRKATILLEKLDADGRLKAQQKRLDILLEKQNQIEDAQDEKEKNYKREIQKLQVDKFNLKTSIAEHEHILKESVKAYEKTQAELQVENKLPAKNINFTQAEQTEENPREEQPANISYTCHIVICHPYDLHPGQALLTFESEEVAKAVIDKGKHVIKLNKGNVDVRAHGVNLSRTVEFEVNMNFSTKKLFVQNLPPNLPDEMLKDKMELTFYKSDIGGGEVEAVEYNRNSNSAIITYLQNGVPQRVLKRKQHQFTAGGSVYEATVEPVIDQQLNKLQIFSGLARRTVLLEDIQDDQGKEDEIQDILEIHFQKPRNGGGEVEAITYAMEENKAAYFEVDEDEA